MRHELMMRPMASDVFIRMRRLVKKPAVRSAMLSDTALALAGRPNGVNTGNAHTTKPSAPQKYFTTNDSSVPNCSCAKYSLTEWRLSSSKAWLR